jgi:hypothetical protein
MTNRIAENLLSKESSGHSGIFWIHYKGINIYEAAALGNYLICHFLFERARNKSINMLASDSLGNNPLHYAVVAKTPEVVINIVFKILDFCVNINLVSNLDY